MNIHTKTPLITTLEDYFKKELPNLKKNYTWPIPQIEGFNVCGYGYEENVALKQHLSNEWKKDPDKIKLSKIIVSKWGGVRNNSDTTFKEFIDEISSGNPKMPIKGVASYSKIFSIVDLDRYAIYDARVAACLNAVQWNNKTIGAMAFNYIPGRNNITGNAVNKKGFVFQDPFTRKILIKAGWTKIKRDETYSFYLSTLKECLKSLTEYKLYDLEMVLFANAENECSIAMQSITKPAVT